MIKTPLFSNNKDQLHITSYYTNLRTSYLTCISQVDIIKIYCQMFVVRWDENSHSFYFSIREIYPCMSQVMT